MGFPFVVAAAVDLLGGGGRGILVSVQVEWLLGCLWIDKGNVSAFMCSV